MPYKLMDVPTDCPLCGKRRVVDVDMAYPDSEPFAWCRNCCIATFKEDEIDNTEKRPN